MNIGDVVVSLKGHDRGSFYVVIGVEDDSILLCDGKRKLLSDPKKKNIKHLNTTGEKVDLSSYTPLYDAHIRKALKKVSKEISL
ncbi:MAG: hypothetical protein E7406_09595 [Ruminococcaceae bacterium]|nr:hypothetical protein [Oscillospiraceae bacterium]